MTAALLSLVDVNYTYPAAPRPAVAGLDLELAAGRRCGLIGDNGCGKTTLLLLATGLLEPQRGCLHWRGEPLPRRLHRLRAYRRQVALVFQNPEHQLVGTTVEEDLAYGLLNQGVPEPQARERLRQVAAEFDLLPLLQQPVHQLSLGQKKMLSLADVMVLQPQLLLLDEPTAYLSPGRGRLLRRQLDRIHAAGTTILLASHDLAFLRAWADWLLVMDRGRIVLQGPPAQVLAQQELLEAINLAGG